MGSQSDLQRLQTGCQELLLKKGAFSGFLRRKTILHKLCEGGFAEQLTSKISWQRRYFVVHDGFLYNYKSETDVRPVKVIDLRAYKRVERDENLKVNGVPWPLKISSDIPMVKILRFGATSEPELNKWIEVIRKGIDEAKESGREPVVIEKKKRLQLTKMKMPRKKQPQHSDEDDDLYTDPGEPEAEYQSGSDYSSINEEDAGSENSDYSSIDEETKHSIRTKTKTHQRLEKHASGKERPHEKAQPQPPDKGHGPSKGNPTDKKPAGPSRSNPASDSTDRKPAGPTRSNPPSANIQHTEDDLKPLASPRKKPYQNVGKNLRPKQQEASDLVSEATWKGTPEEGTDTAVEDVNISEFPAVEVAKVVYRVNSTEVMTWKMKSIDEDGVFMLRESTTGNGELTLQIISDDAVRKYRITKEGKQFRMAGGETFDSMAELLSFYQKNSIPNHSTKLTKPYSRI